MRGGLLIAKPAGGLASGAFSVNLTTVRPELPLDTVTRVDAVGGLRECLPDAEQSKRRRRSGDAAPQREPANRFC